MSIDIPTMYGELQELPKCLVTDKHLTDRKQLKTIVLQSLSPYFEGAELQQLSHLLAIEIKVAICSGLYSIEEELTLIFQELKGRIPISSQKKKIIRTICQTILSCAELK